MSILEDLNALCAGLEIPVETGVFSDEAPDAYIVITPLSDTFDLHADNAPGVDVQEARLSLYVKGSYTALKNRLVRLLLQNGFTVTGRMYNGYETDTGYHHCTVDAAQYALLAFVVLDYITGVMCAVVDKKLSSEIGFKGIFKKVLIFALVGIGHILDTQVIGAGSVLRTAVIFFYLSNEGVSLIENAGHLGLPIPKKLKAVLEQLHDRAEKEENSNDDEH